MDQQSYACSHATRPAGRRAARTGGSDFFLIGDHRGKLLPPVLAHWLPKRADPPTRLGHHIRRYRQVCRRRSSHDGDADLSRLSSTANRSTEVASRCRW